MFKVALIERHSKEEIGEIGEYDSYEEAKLEADDYNRKGDRHRGHAVVQTTIDPDQPVMRTNPVRSHGSTLRLNRRPSGIPTRDGIPQRVQSQRTPENHRTVRPERTEPVMRQRPVQSRPVQPRPIQPRPTVTTPVNKPTVSSSPQQSGDVYILVWDDILRRPLVLKDGSFTRQMIMAGIGRYEVIEQGEFYEIMSERNRLAKSGRQ